MLKCFNMPKQPEGENNTGLPSEEHTQKNNNPTGFFSPDVFGIPFEFTKLLDTESWGSPWMWCYREVWKAFDNIKDELLSVTDTGLKYAKSLDSTSEFEFFVYFQKMFYTSEI